MRAGAARGHVGHFHEAGFYGSDREFRALIVPFVEEGVASGEPVIIGYDDRNAGLLRSWLRDPSAVTFIADRSLYVTPAGAIATYRRLFDGPLARGAEQIRIAGDVPHPGNGGRFEGWDRYESAMNAVWADIPVWGLCLYDTATAPAAVLDIAERTHPQIALPLGEHRVSRRYQDPSVFDGLPVPPDPLEALAPTAALVIRSPADARHALQQAGRGCVHSETLQDLLIGVSEAASNALLYGRPPVTVRVWAASDRIVADIHDEGDGPADRLAGLVPVSRSESNSGMGLGLWVMHQLGVDVALRYSGDGFAVRLRGGRII